MYKKIYAIVMLALIGVVFGYKPIVANPLFFQNNKDGKISDVQFNAPPIARNDTFVYYTGCDDVLTGNVIANDSDENGDLLEIYFAVTPRPGNFSMQDDGTFTIQIPEWYEGTLEFSYYIVEKSADQFRATATVYINVYPDSDCDGVFDADDLDKDNDGIPDIDEGDGAIDSDGDGIPDSRDIDSDNDGITDNIEWQEENNYIAPLNIDANNNGWDDAYDSSAGGKYFSAFDTNNNGVPDYLDTDTDSDGISDLIEAFDVNNDGFSDVLPFNEDVDKDGLDDAFDNVKAGNKSANPMGSNCVLIDFNKNGVRDWRDSSNRFYGIKCFIYPNPVADGFRIIHPDLRSGQSMDVRLFSIDGKLIFQKELISSPDIIQIPFLNNGVYRILVNSEGFVSSQNIIIAR